MATFVLVHGAFVGGWCWRGVTPFLRDAGHEVLTPTLTGHGERAHLAGPGVDLDTHIVDIVNVLNYEDLAGVVLVGWSYGGMIVAGAADRVPERVGHLIYLDSDIPRDGDTSAPASTHAYRQALADAHGDGWRVPPLSIGADTVLFEGLDDTRRRWIAERWVPQHLVTWTEPIRLAGVATAIPSTYVRCTVDYDPTDEDTMRQDARIKSEPTWRYMEIPERHIAPFTAPEAVAKVLLEVV